jgi:hypothetical protein
VGPAHSGDLRQTEANFAPGGRWDEASVGTSKLDLALLSRAAGPRGHGALGGEVQPGSGSLALTEWDRFVTVAVRNALADFRPAALPPY